MSRLDTTALRISLKVSRKPIELFAVSFANRMFFMRKMHGRF